MRETSTSPTSRMLPALRTSPTSLTSTSTTSTTTKAEELKERARKLIEQTKREAAAGPSTPLKSPLRNKSSSPVNSKGILSGILWGFFRDSLARVGVGLMLWKMELKEVICLYCGGIFKGFFRDSFGILLGFFWNCLEILRGCNELIVEILTADFLPIFLRDC